jgi:D-serine dehydratase
LEERNSLLKVSGKIYILLLTFYFLSKQEENIMHEHNKAINDVVELKPLVWINPKKIQCNIALEEIELKYEDIRCRKKA